MSDPVKLHIRLLVGKVLTILYRYYQEITNGKLMFDGFRGGQARLTSIIEVLKITDWKLKAEQALDKHSALQ